MVLARVGATGSLSRAATILGCSPSTVHAHLAAIEETVGTPVYTRSRSGVSLTPAGSELAPYGAQISEALAAAGVTAHKTVASRGRVLRIAAFGANPIISVFLHALARRGHRLTVELATLDPAPAVELVRAREFEALVGYGVDLDAAAQATDDLEVESIITVPLWAALRRDHPHLARETLSLAQLKGDPWVTAEPGSAMHAGVTAACQSAGFEPEIRYAVDRDSILGLLALDGCVSLVPAAISTADLPVTVAPLVEDLHLRMYLAWCRESSHGVALRALAAMLRRQYAAWLQRSPALRERTTARAAAR